MRHSSAHRWATFAVKLSILLAGACGGSHGAATPVATGAPADTAASAMAADVEVVEASIDDLQEAMAAGRITARQLVTQYSARIERLNQKGPALHAVIELNPEALAIADALDRERRTKGPRGPLHGIPVLLKDNIGTADELETTAGSLALIGHRPAKDSTVAARLRDAGAIVLGKSNMSEWANFRSSHSSSGWSARGGQTRNPYVLDRSPCGSSSGSAVGTAASLATLSIGTETDGSIICPSGTNGIVGLKPTVGLVSRAGIIPISESQDTAGPMTRSVREAALVLNALAGSDPADPSTIGRDGDEAVDYTRFLDADALKGARIGVARSHMGGSPDVDDVMQQALALMVARGAVLVDVELPPWPLLAPSVHEVLESEFKDGVERYLAGLDPESPKTIAALLRFNEEHADEEMPIFRQELLEKAAQKPGLESPTYLEARERAKSIAQQGIDSALREHRLDAIVAPSNGPAWLIDQVNGDHFQIGSSSPAAVAGYPNLTVPAGLVHELPVGISFMGAAFSEGKLLAMAYAFEQASRSRRVPRYLPSLPLE